MHGVRVWPKLWLVNIVFLFFMEITFFCSCVLLMNTFFNILLYVFSRYLVPNK